MEKITKWAPFILLATTVLASFLITFSVSRQESPVAGESAFWPANYSGLQFQNYRLIPILLTLLLIVLIYYFSRGSLGKWWALLPSLLFGLSPTVLANSHYLTTDISAALGVLLAIYTFDRYVSSPSPKRLIIAGLAFGTAELLGASTPLLIVFFVMLTTFYAATIVGRDRWNVRRMRSKKIWENILSYYGTMILILAIGLALAAYPLHLFSNLTSSQQATTGTNLYFMGKVTNVGDILDLPVIYALKEPLPVTILLLITIGLSLFNIIRAIKRKHPTFAEYLGTNFQEFSVFLFIILYLVWNIASPLNTEMRYLLPILPLVYILIATGIKKWTQDGHLLMKLCLVALLLAWFLGEVAASYPYYLSYFNELVGKDNGYRYATEANYDWGQDLGRLATFVQNNNIKTIAVDYYGGGNVNYYLGNAAVPWQSNDGDPRWKDISWLAVSASQLQLATEPLAGNTYRDPESSYAWLTNLRSPAPGMGNIPQPDYIVGTSIFIYKLEGAPGT
ncbi:MAG: glycosyltransferase family 39 protein [Patescibacteria group bacterium]|nr:glycosyltransferase family 39 protein [Patescibacteria group bacterium]MCL5224142.1 glycosyltransferase family 39 protein [Patescibacteria group bacterium]